MLSSSRRILVVAVLGRLIRISIVIVVTTMSRTIRGSEAWVPAPLSPQDTFFLARAPRQQPPKASSWTCPLVPQPPGNSAPRRGSTRHTTSSSSSTTTTRLQLVGQQPQEDSNPWWDQFRSRLPEFLQTRDGDFAPLDSSSLSEPLVVGGTCPVLFLYQVPDGVADDEIRDMLQDEAPSAVQRGVTIRRLSPIEDHAVLDLSLRQALTEQNHPDNDDNNNNNNNSVSVSSRTSTDTTTSDHHQQSPPVAVLLFHGFASTEMLRVYRTLAAEITAETAGASLLVACATVVPRALDKPLRQVLEEIAGDHRDAVRTIT